MMIFTMLLTCSTMEGVFFGDYEDRLKLDDTLVLLDRAARWSVHCPRRRYFIARDQ
jgi:hypothetical protein